MDTATVTCIERIGGAEPFLVCSGSRSQLRQMIIDRKFKKNCPYLSNVKIMNCKYGQTNHSNVQLFF